MLGPAHPQRTAPERAEQAVAGEMQLLCGSVHLAWRVAAQARALRMHTLQKLQIQADRDADCLARQV